MINPQLLALLAAGSGGGSQILHPLFATKRDLGGFGLPSGYPPPGPEHTDEEWSAINQGRNALLAHELKRKAEQEEAQRDRTLMLLRRAGAGNMLSSALQGGVSPELQVTGGPLPPQYARTNETIMNAMDRVRGQYGQGPYAPTEESLDNLVKASRRQEMLNSLTPSQRRMLSPIGRPQPQSGLNAGTLRKLLLRAGPGEVGTPESMMAARMAGIDPSRVGAMGQGFARYGNNVHVMTPETHGTYGLAGNARQSRETREASMRESLTNRYRQKVKMLGRSLGLSEGFDPDAADHGALKSELEKLRSDKIAANKERIASRDAEAEQRTVGQLGRLVDPEILKRLPLKQRIAIRQAEYDNWLKGQKLEGDREDRDIRRKGTEGTIAYQEGQVSLGERRLTNEEKAAKREADHRHLQLEFDKNVQQWREQTQNESYQLEKLKFEQMEELRNKEYQLAVRKQGHEEEMAKKALDFEQLGVVTPQFQNAQQKVDAQITLSSRIVTTAKLIRDNNFTEAQKHILYADAAEFFSDQWKDVESAPDWSASDVERIVNRYNKGDFDKQYLEDKFKDNMSSFEDFWYKIFHYIPFVSDHPYPTPSADEL